MSWFTDFLTDTARQAAPGIHQGINDDQKKKRELEQARSGIPIEVERQKALMPGEIEKIEATGRAAQSRDAANQEAAFRRAIALQYIKNQTKAQPPDDPIGRVLGGKYTMQNPNYSASEEAAGPMGQAPTENVGGLEWLRRQRDVPSGHVPEIKADAKGTSVEWKPPPLARQEARPLAPHYLSKPDGSTWVVDAPGAEPRQIQPAIKTAQPLTSEATAAAFAGVPEGQRPNPDQAKKMNEYLAGRTGERRGATIEAEAAHAPAAARYAAAKARAIKDVGLEYLPLEVRARAQEALNVATDPKNIASVAKKIAAEEEARQGAKALPEADKQSVALLNTTKWAMQQLKTEFSAEERERFVGVLRNPALRAAQFLNPDPRFSKFQAIMGRVKKSAFDDGGKQLTPFEFSVVAQYIPQGNEASWQDYEEKLSVAEAYTDMLINARMSLARTPRMNLPTSGVTHGVGSSQAPSISGDPMEGRTATNPQTGQKIIRRNGRWEAVQ